MQKIWRYGEPRCSRDGAVKMGHKTPGLLPGRLLLNIGICGAPKPTPSEIFIFLLPERA